MKIVLHGKLARLFGAEHEINTDTVFDAIEGLSRQLPAWPREMLIDVVDFETDQKLRARTEAKEVHLVPALCGGGGVGKILIGAALIAAVILIPGAWAVIGTVQLSSIALSIGVALVLSGVMQLFMKAPTIDKSDDPPASKYLGAQGNTTEIGTYRTLAWGRNRIAGHWLSIQVDAKSIVLGRFPVTPPA